MTGPLVPTMPEGDNRGERGGWLLRPRHIGVVAVVLGLTAAGFIAARALAERDARHDSQHRIDVAAAQIRSRVEEAASLTESLSRYMVDAGGVGVTNDRFARTVLRWLSPAEFPAAAWAEQVRSAQRASYERRTGQPIVAPGARLEKVPPGSSYLPATLVSGFPPMNLRGVDLKREPGIPAALRLAIQPGGVGVTPIAARRDGTRGLFLVAAAANVIDGVLRPGAVVVFISETTLRSAARNVAGLRFPAADKRSDAHVSGDVVRDEFTVAGQRLAVVMPRESVNGPGAVLPWLILAAGLVLAGLAGALEVNSARRAKAQADYDRLFNLSPDLITVADFEGHFTRVNPAVEQVLGYTQEKFLARPYLEFVHPDDRERTLAEVAAIERGKSTLSFENRFVREDGSSRVLDWTSTPVVEDRLMYGVARDVTERRRAEAEVKRLADEQAAFRRVATLVAREASQAEVFAAVAEEVRRLLAVDEIRLLRFERDDHDDAVVVAGPDEREDVPIGLRDVVAAPIIVEGQRWGAFAVGTMGSKPLPPETESRLAQFGELMATSIANAEARAEVERLATEQAALRRVATMVARGSPAEEVFAKVAEEVGLLLGLDVATVRRFEPDGWGTIVGRWGELGDLYQVGTRMKQEGQSVTTVVYGTGRSARFDDYEGAGSIPADARKLGLRAAVASPIIVDGRLWGAIAAGTSWAEPMPADAESRMADFTELVAAAISNAQARSDLAASRARLVAAADDERRRVVRDLHDGAQQRLVHTVVTLTLAQRALRASEGTAALLVAEALEHAKQGNAELRELAHGILPSALTHGGLRAGIDAVASRLDVPVQLNAPAERFPPEIEATAYFIVAESLTNVVKHSHAEHAVVRASVEDGTLRVEIHDDGIGGADPDGHGLMGIGDRVTALGGQLDIDSPAGGGTLLAATLPLPAT